jgi:hypothetical protein
MAVQGQGSGFDGRRCPHCGTFAAAELVICPSCDGTLPFIIPSAHFTGGRQRRRFWRVGAR